MKRMHVHVSVADLEQSTRFYSTLFGAAPTVLKPEYAKWMLEDPRINFAISKTERRPGVDHLGMQVDAVDELEEIGTRLQAADAVTGQEKDMTGCYARSDKYWARDPQGLRWESFYTHGEAPVYSIGKAVEEAKTCCNPKDAGKPGCCL